MSAKYHLKFLVTILFGILNTEIKCQLVNFDPTLSPFFSPSVTATCRDGLMTIKVETDDNFQGVVQSRDYKKPECSSYGENAKVTFLRINLLTQKQDKDYCGVFLSEITDEYSVTIGVRQHKTLELAQDKFFLITCGKAGIQNSKSELSVVSLELLRKNQKVQHAFYGQDYTLRANITKANVKYDMLVKRCFSFSNTNNTVTLVDDQGCPNPNIMSEFKYNRLQGIAEAKLFSMFKFPQSNRVHFQCDIVLCKGRCPETNCNKTITDGSPQPVSLDQQEGEDGAFIVSYSVFVSEPGDVIDEEYICQDCTLNNSLVYYLCLAFGTLFLAMVVVNAYLCCAMTGKAGNLLCFRKEIVSHIKSSRQSPEDFDPYARSWHDSQYGSRFHLNSMSSKVSSTPSNGNPNKSTRSDRKVFMNEAFDKDEWE